MTSSWFFLSTLNYDARSTTHQIYYLYCFKTPKIQDVRCDCCYNVFREVAELIFTVALARACCSWHSTKRIFDQQILTGKLPNMDNRKDTEIKTKMWTDPVCCTLQLWLTQKLAVNGMFTAEGRITVTFNKVFNEGNLIEFEVNTLFISLKLLYENRR